MINYDQLIDLLRARRSIRRFSDRGVCRGDLEKVLEAARWAPSNHNRQPWRFVVVEDRQRIHELADAVGRELSGRLNALPAVATAWTGELAHHATLFADAPVLVVVLHKKPASFAGGLLSSVEHPELVSGEPLSVAMAVQNLLLAAHALGLGACVMTAPLLAPEALGSAVPPPPGFDFTCLVALGWPEESPEPPRRKGLEHIAEFQDSPDVPHEDRRGNL